jgi:SRSO17 transposase
MGHHDSEIMATLELWASSLRKVKSLMRPLFAQDRAAVNAGLFLDGLLGDERRKTGWMRAEATGNFCGSRAYGIRSDCFSVTSYRKRRAQTVWFSAGHDIRPATR